MHQFLLQTGRVGLPLWVALLIAVGCAKKTPAFRPPSPRIEQTHFVGSAVTGAQSAGNTPSTSTDLDAGAMLVTVQVVAMKELPATGAKLVSTGADARLFVASRDRQPILSTGELTARAMWVSGADADAFAKQIESLPKESVARIVNTSIALPKNVTAVVSVNDAAVTSEPRQVQVFLHNTTGAPVTAPVPKAPSSPPATPPAADPMCEIALGVADMASGEIEGEKSASGPQWQRELMVLRPVALSGNNIVGIVVPFEFSASDARWVAIVLRFNPNPQAKDSRFVSAMDKCRADVARESAAAEARIAQLLNTKLGEASWPGFEAAFASAANAGSRRQAMVFLASQSGARLARNVYLVAPDEMLEGLLKEAAAKIETVKPADRDAATLSWVLDLTTLQKLAKMSSDGKLPPGVAAVLTTYAGEAGRHAGSIEEIAKTVNGRGELQTRLIAENMIFLEDSSPAARVRAYDWLRAQQHGPVGYDPLGSPKERRDALEKAIAPAATPSTAPASATVAN